MSYASITRIVASVSSAELRTLILALDLPETVQDGGNPLDHVLARFPALHEVVVPEHIWATQAALNAGWPLTVLRAQVTIRQCPRDELHQI